MSCLSAVLVTCVVLANGSVRSTPAVLSVAGNPPTVQLSAGSRYRVSADLVPDTSSVPLVREREAWNLGDVSRYQYMPGALGETLRYYAVGVNLEGSDTTAKVRIKRGGAMLYISRSW